MAFFQVLIGVVFYILTIDGRLQIHPSKSPTSIITSSNDLFANQFDVYAIHPTAQPTASFPVEEYLALFDLYNSTHGDDWTWKLNTEVNGNKWNFNNPSANPCAEKWQGISCGETYNNESIITALSDSQQTITALCLTMYNMRGTLPDTISGLQNLVNLNISNNHLVGSLPRTIGNMTKLQTILIGFNKLDGAIPIEITNCVKLTELKLNGNAFHGTIHKSFGNLTQLSVLNIQQNSLIGSVPDELGKLTNLRELALNQNELTGTLPETLSNLSVLQNMELNNNNLNGSIPLTYSNLSLLYQLVLANNDLTGTLDNSLANLSLLKNLNLGTNSFCGTIPNSFGNLTRLTNFDVSHNNHIFGTLPLSLTQCSKLITFYVEGNFLHGTIHREFEQLEHLVILELSNNQFSGTIPPQLANITDLSELDVSNNALTGTLPPEFSQMLYLNKLIVASNNLNGTIPAALGNLTGIRGGALVELDLSTNRFTGSLPPELGNLVDLAVFSVANNRLTSTIPSSLGRMTRLTSMALNNNLFTGEVPQSFENITLLESIYVNNNLLQGTIPSAFSKLKALNGLYLHDNSFTGWLPSFLGELQLLQTIAIQNNAFSGPLPAALSNLTILNQLLVWGNELTGTIPAELTVTTNKILQYISLNDNYISGNLPEDLDNLEVLLDFNVNGNYFSGTIPYSFGNVTVLKYLDVSDNLLVGTLPAALSKLRLLELLFVQNNRLTGRLDVFVNSTLQKSLTNIDVSNNQFIGNIPTEPFKIRVFETFAAVSNCLTGAIPLVICEADALTSLALDGISTATTCQQRYLKTERLPPTYTLKHSVQGGVPACLFNMSNLQTLHLSGNGLSGSLGDDIVVGPTLRDLSLSYNVLTGTLPSAIQQNIWSNLDLSYNKITGVLSSSMYDPHNSSLVLRVNRLSGKIPNQIMNATDIDMLDGNIFSCSYGRSKSSDLPQSDPDAETYNCGSNSADIALYVWLGLATIVCAVLVLGALKVYERFPSLQCFKKYSDLFTLWMSVYTNDEGKTTTFNNIHILGNFLNDLRYMYLVSTGYLLLIAMPIYGALSLYYNTYTYEYAWTISAVYLSGFVPALMLFIVSSAVLLIVMYNAVHKTQYLLIDEFALPHIDTSKINKWQVIITLSIAVVNCVLVVMVNVGYVLVTLNYDTQIVVIAQLCLAFFKISWNEAVLRSIVYINKYYNTLRGDGNKSMGIMLPTCLLLFNSIACPCLATLAISPDCFRSLFVAPSEVTASYQYLACDQLATNSLSVCTSYTTVTSSTSYPPPFTYSFQCSSALVTNYASIYVFMFMFKGFGLPVLLYALKSIHDCVVGEANTGGNVMGSTRCGRLLSAVLPDFLRSIDQLEYLNRGSVFYKEVFVLRIISITAIYLTFGVMFPPIAGVACVALFSHGYCSQLILGRLLKNAEARSVLEKYTAILVQDCKETSDLLWHSIYPLFPLCSVFYSFFIYDAYGDVVGWNGALWLTVLTIFMPIIIRLSLKVYEMRFPIVQKVIERRRIERRKTDNTRASERRKTGYSFSFMSFSHSFFSEKNNNSMVSEDQGGENEFGMTCGGGGGGYGTRNNSIVSGSSSSNNSIASRGSSFSVSRLQAINNQYNHNKHNNSNSSNNHMSVDGVELSSLATTSGGLRSITDSSRSSSGAVDSDSSSGNVDGSSNATIKPGSKTPTAGEKKAVGFGSSSAILDAGCPDSKSANNSGENSSSGSNSNSSNNINHKKDVATANVVNDNSGSNNTSPINNSGNNVDSGNGSDIGDNAESTVHNILMSCAADSSDKVNNMV